MTTAWGGALLLGRYRIGEVLGSGGMGTVARAHDEVLDRAVAIKFLRDDLAGDGPAAARFRREARIAASLTHPGIAQVYDFAEEDGRPFIVMELLDGVDLHGLLLRGERPDPRAAAGIVVAAAEALGAAHAAGAVHRDVKPGNIFLTRAGAVKVTDFGIASASQQVPLTETGKMLGTSWYVSPEQARGERAGPPSDVYALGCVLFHLLTGRPPFEAETSVAVAMAHVSDPVPSAREANPAVPPEIDAVVRTAMSKDPAERHPDGTRLAAALRTTGALTAPSWAPVVSAVLPVAGAAAQAAQAGIPGAGVPTELSPPLGTGPRTMRLGEEGAQALPPVPAAAVGVGAAGPGPDADALPLPAGEPPGARLRPRRRRLFLLAAALGLAALLLALGIGRIPRPPPPVTLPDWVGHQGEEASEDARRLGLRLHVNRESSLKAANEVLSQNPPGGTSLPAGSDVTIAISLGDLVPVPSVKDRTLDEARRVLTAAGLVAQVDEVHTADSISSLFGDLGLDTSALEALLLGRRADVVVDQDPEPGATAHRGDRVRLTIVRAPVVEEDRRGKGKNKDEGGD